MTILDTIVEKKREESPLLDIPAERVTGKEPVSLSRSLKKSVHPLGIIAEVKKASPSKGLLSPDFKPVRIAEEYAALNVAGISVLTDESFFQGHPQHLTAVKNKVDIPVLRKDFIIEEKQVLFSERIGADAVLLIAAILEGKQLAYYHDMAVELGLDVLVEVHNEEELEKVLSHCSPSLIGVNNRDLKTFRTDLDVTARLSKLIPENSLLISESGIHSKDDADAVKEAGAGGILVGEAFMKSSDRRSFLNSLFSREVT